MEKGKIQHDHINKLKTLGIILDDYSELELIKYKKSETIIREGFPMEHLLFVQSGKAKVFASADNGRDLLLGYYVEDGIIGDLELMMGEYVASTTMVALTEFVCIALPYKKWSALLKTNVIFLNLIGRELAAKLIESSNKGVVTILHDGEKRLCTYLLQVTPNDVLEEPLTNAASSIGLSYRQVLRIIKSLCEANILRKVGKYYRVIDRKALKNRGILE